MRTLSRRRRVGSEFDTRTDPDDPWSGWFMSADVWSTAAGPTTSAAPMSGLTATSRSGPSHYTRGFFDFRRYNRLGPRRTAEHAPGPRRLARRRSAAARAPAVGRRTRCAAGLRLSQRSRRNRRRDVQRWARPCQARRRNAIGSRSRRSSIAAICASTSRASGTIGRATITARTATSCGCCLPTPGAGGASESPERHAELRERNVAAALDVPVGHRTRVRFRRHRSLCGEVGLDAGGADEFLRSTQASLLACEPPSCSPDYCGLRHSWRSATA